MSIFRDLKDSFQIHVLIFIRCDIFEVLILLHHLNKPYLRWNIHLLKQQLLNHDSLWNSIKVFSFESIFLQFINKFMVERIRGMKVHKMYWKLFWNFMAIYQCNLESSNVSDWQYSIFWPMINERKFLTKVNKK
jgi:hypothetical protein